MTIDIDTFLFATHEQFSDGIGVTNDPELLNRLHHKYAMHDGRTSQGDSDPIVRFLRGKKMRNVFEFFNELSAVLQFPDYFGENWNALWDLLTDLSWIRPFSNLILVIHQPELLLIDDPDFMQTWIRQCDEARFFWNPPQGVADGKNIEPVLDHDEDLLKGWSDPVIYSTEGSHAIRFLYDGDIETIRGNRQLWDYGNLGSPHAIEWTPNNTAVYLA